MVAWLILEKSQLGALCLSHSCQASRPWPTPPASASLPALLPHLLSAGFGPRYLGKKQLSEVTMWPTNPADFPPCHLTLMSKFQPLYLQIFPFSRPLFPQDIPPPNQLLLFPQEWKQTSLPPGSLPSPSASLLPPLPANTYHSCWTPGSHADWRSCEDGGYVYLLLLSTFFHVDSQFASLQPIPPV